MLVGCGANNYDECVANQAKKGLSRYALGAVRSDCYNKFHRELTSKELDKLKLDVERLEWREPGKRYNNVYGGGTFVAESPGLLVQISVFNGNKNIEVHTAILECKTSGWKWREVHAHQPGC